MSTGRKEDDLFVVGEFQNPFIKHQLSQQLEEYYKKSDLTDSEPEEDEDSYRETSSAFSGSFKDLCISDDPILKEGWLNKRNGLTTVKKMYTSKWGKRYFKLQGNLLARFKHAKSNKPFDCVNISEFYPYVQSWKEQIFGLRSDEKERRFQSPKISDMIDWIRCFEDQSIQKGKIIHAVEEVSFKLNSKKWGPGYLIMDTLGVLRVFKREDNMSFAVEVSCVDADISIDILQNKNSKKIRAKNIDETTYFKVKCGENHAEFVAKTSEHRQCIIDTIKDLGTKVKEYQERLATEAEEKAKKEEAELKAKEEAEKAKKEAEKAELKTKEESELKVKEEESKKIEKKTEEETIEVEKEKKEIKQKDEKKIKKTKKSKKKVVESETETETSESDSEEEVIRKKRSSKSLSKRSSSSKRRHRHRSSRSHSHRSSRHGTSSRRHRHSRRRRSHRHYSDSETDSDCYDSEYDSSEYDPSETESESEEEVIVRRKRRSKKRTSDKKKRSKSKSKHESDDEE
eukprot:TRINITY_DN5518_c0_g1_i1.p1 TRINITY_DN5518_c0_g1~~TRINITY_DN5518_c0_g1_i1.p1  ORF type:complete len:513 (+),score=183.85 TRINITY_DN5518_c0_g1_i1:107-1645(+)